MTEQEGREITQSEERPTPEKRLTPFDLGVAAISTADLIALAAEAEKRMEAFKTIWKAGLGLTNPNDWSDQSGKPYLEASGAHKIGRWLGVSWRPIRDPEDQKLFEEIPLGAGHYLILFTGEFAWRGNIITEVGSRASNEPFFCTRYEGYGEARHEVLLPASEVDKGDVIKSAWTNAQERGITALLGFRDLSWADLQQFAQIKQEDVSRVQYRKSGKLPRPSEPVKKDPAQKPPAERQSQPADTGGPITQDQARAILALLEKEGLKDDLAKMTKVKEIVGLLVVPTSLGKLTQAQAGKVIQALQEEVSQ